MKNLAGLFALLIALLCISGSAYSTGTWKSYTVADGLAGGNIHAITEDKRGDLWIATDGDGVSRYDGKDFRNFSTEDGLPSNYVWAILEDSKGSLWFATGVGVCKYDGKSFGTILNTKTGLVHNFVTSVIEDRKGNLWFGTKGGVSKYDGKKFVNFTTEDGLVDNHIRAIFEDSEGNLWFATRRSGVSRYDGERFVSFTTENGLADDFVRAIHEDSEGNLWFGTNNGASRYDGKRFVSFTTKDGLVNDTVKSFLRDSAGNLWFGTDGGVSKYDGKDFQNLTSKDGLVGDDVRAIYESREGNLWFGIWGPGISKYDTRIQHYLRNKTIEYQLEDSNGYLWFVAREGGIFRYDGKVFQDFTAKVGQIGEEAPIILEDRNGNLWFTGLGGVTKYNGVEFQTVGDIVLKDTLVEPIFEDSQGNLWLSIWEHGTTIKIGRYDGKDFHYFPVKGKIYPSNSEDKRALEDKDGNIWFVTADKGVYRYDGRGLTYFTTDDGIAGSKVSSLAEDRSGNLWFGVRENDIPDAKGIGGLSMYSGEFSADTKYQNDLDMGNIPEGLEQTFRNNELSLSQNAGVVVATEGRRWLIRDLLFSVGANSYSDLDNGNIPKGLEQAFAADGIALSQNVMVSMGEEAGRQWRITDRVNKRSYTVRKNGDKLDIYDNRQTYVIRKDDDKLNISRFLISRFLIYSTKDGLSSDSVTGISTDGDGNLWFRTYHGGLSKYDGKSFEKFTMKNGLASNTIRSMLKDKEGNLWFGSQGAGVSKYDGKNFQTLTTADGLLNNTAYIALADSRGDIWFRYSVPGLTRYTPCKDVLPRVVITQVIADETYQVDQAKHEVTVPPKTRVVFHYKGLTLNQFHNILYSYKLEGYDKTFNTTRKREKEYENLKPGTYEFQVTAIDRDLNYSVPQSLKLTMLPPFYRTRKFIILSSIGAFALCLFIFEYFSHRKAAVQLREELWQRSERERQRIRKEVQDAHDIQMNLMSGPPPTLAEFDVHGDCRPAREVGGDFFRFICPEQEDERFAIALGDVCGKGMKAAWTAVMADGMLYFLAKLPWFSAGQLLSELNTGLCERKTDEISYVAFCLASIDVKEKILQFSNAGQKWPIIKRGEDLITIEEVSGPPLGMMTNDLHREIYGEIYGERNVPLKEGDIIVFYTDGITDAANQRDEVYTSERLESVLRKVDPGLSASQIADEIFRDVNEFTGGADQYDDMTVVVLKVNGKRGGDING